MKKIVFRDIISLLVLMIKNQFAIRLTRQMRRLDLISAETSHTFNIPSLKNQNHSVSTHESESPRSSQCTMKDQVKPYKRADKEKSQLCKKFMDFGFCPYQKKCKFAHGSHQLRKNQQANTKYKTKECGVFKNTGCCMFGDRCNFIHKVSENESYVEEKFDGLFQGIKAGGRQQSRLLTILSRD